MLETLRNGVGALDEVPNHVTAIPVVNPVVLETKSSRLP